MTSFGHFQLPNTLEKIRIKTVSYSQISQRVYGHLRIFPKSYMQTCLQQIQKVHQVHIFTLKTAIDLILLLTLSLDDIFWKIFPTYSVYSSPLTALSRNYKLCTRTS